MCQCPGGVGCLLSPVECTHSLPRDSRPPAVPVLNTSTVLPAGNPENKAPILMGQQLCPWACLTLTLLFFWHRLPGVLGTVRCVTGQPIRAWISILYQQYSGLVHLPSFLSPQGGQVGDLASG